MSALVLSIFPGIDLLGRAFEEERYSIVRGPDPLWGGDIRRFHVPTGVFEGVIGGPPCQYWTRLMFLNKQAGHKNGEPLDWVVNEYARVVEEAQPLWFLMEEVVYAPMPLVPGYHDYDVVLRDNEVGGVQPRERRFTFGTKDYRMLNVIGWERVAEVAASIPEGRQRTISGPLTPSQRRRTAEVLAERRKQSVLADGRAVPVKLLANGKEKRSITSAGTGAHGSGRGEGWDDGRLPGGTRLGGPRSPTRRASSSAKASPRTARTTCGSSRRRAPRSRRGNACSTRPGGNANGQGTSRGLGLAFARPSADQLLRAGRSVFGRRLTSAAATFAVTTRGCDLSLTRDPAQAGALAEVERIDGELRATAAEDSPAARTGGGRNKFV